MGGPLLMRFGKRRVMLVLAVLGLVLGSAGVADAVTTQGRTSVRLSLPGAVQTSTYTIGNFRTANNETVTGYTITFPSDAVVTGATSPGNTVQQLGGNTIRVTLGTPVGRNTTFSIIVGNIVNPSAPGSYSITQAIFHRAAGGNQTVTWPAAQGTFAIFATPYLVLSITTPGLDQNIDLGQIDPGVTVNGGQILVEVTSSAPFNLTRTLGGDASRVGLSVTGTAEGAGPTGVTSYVDDIAVTPPWTTDANTPLVATITYTVVQ